MIQQGTDAREAQEKQPTYDNCTRQVHPTTAPYMQRGLVATTLPVVPLAVAEPKGSHVNSRGNALTT